MNFKKIINAQIKLEKALIESHNFDFYKIRHQAIIALITEVAELANEIQSFKYWKKTKKINTDLLNEEYVDGIHFIVSFMIQLKTKYEIKPLIKYSDINEQILSIFILITKFKKHFNKRNIKKIMALYLGLAKLLNISDTEIEKWYFKKNKINFERIKNNY